MSLNIITKILCETKLLSNTSKFNKANLKIMPNLLTIKGHFNDMKQLLFREAVFLSKKLFSHSIHKAEEQMLVEDVN